MHSTQGPANRLAKEKSPYLLQHAHNPVDWYPWGEEAFRKAREEDKPIFLSIGYATCHWCHVMERESFENAEVAHSMNQTFINIKVDREERPDIDNLYMSVCQMMTNRGGWPLTVVMTPDKLPFFAATYLPRESRHGRMGMIDFVPHISNLWRERRQHLLNSAAEIIDLVARSLPTGGGALDRSILSTAFDALASDFDPKYGGFGNAPKFPSPQNLLYLLLYWKRTKNATALNMVEHTLTQLRLGGIFDHIGFGFHRYSTDRQWLVPHFEKMLYDQALLLRAYTEAFLATGNSLFSQTAKEIVDYVLRDMTSEDGGFFTAQDADSEGQEGKFYIWNYEEFREGAGDSSQNWESIFRLKPEGNFKDEASGIQSPDNIPHLDKVLDVNEFDEWETCRKRLFDIRKLRTHPLKDDKILTDWNGLMIASLAYAARVFNEPMYLEAAKSAYRFMLVNMKKPDGSLHHRYREGEAGVDGTIDDYAFISWAALELYRTEFDVDYLRQVIQWDEILTNRFADPASGGYFFTSSMTNDLPLRTVELYEGAMPSGNSVTAMNLILLSRLTGQNAYEERFSGMVDLFAERVKQYPQGFGFFLKAFDFAVSGSNEIVICGGRDAYHTTEMISALNKSYLPQTVVLLKSGDELDEIAPFTRDFPVADGQASAFVCHDFACELPVSYPHEMLQLLEGS